MIGSLLRITINKLYRALQQRLIKSKDYAFYTVDNVCPIPNVLALCKRRERVYDLTCFIKKMLKQKLLKYFSLKLKQFKNSFSYGLAFIKKQYFKIMKIKSYQIYGFWDQPENEIFLKKLLNNDFKRSNYYPDVLFFSVFSNRNKMRNKKAKIKIFYTGENVHSEIWKDRKVFNDNCIEFTDLSLGFDDVFADNYIRLPLWILYYFWDKHTKDEIKKMVDLFNSNRFVKIKNCALIASHDMSGIRTWLYNSFNTILDIHCPGNYISNDKSLKEEFRDNKIEYLKQFVFNICPENESVDGYVTEKIFQALWCDCIPIYYGANSNPEPEVINHNSVIICDKNNIYEKKLMVTELISNQNYYKEFKNNNKLLDSSVDWIYFKLKKVKERIVSIIDNKLK